MSEFCRAIGTSRQNVYQRLQKAEAEWQATQSLRYMVDAVRRDHPRMGAKSLYTRLCPEHMGRDKFLIWYQENGYSVHPQKNWRRTTDSSGVVRFDNLINELQLTDVNQVWVSDITYYELGSRFYYLTLIMDLYSRVIKGYAASQTLKCEHTTIPALKMAMRHVYKHQTPILHSDGGGQYYSKAFLTLTKGRFLNSMGKTAYENPHAERLNGTIKNNYIKPYNPTSYGQLKLYLAKAVRMYNQEKPHQSLGKVTPFAFECQVKLQNKQLI